jgi:hypothetical protein
MSLLTRLIDWVAHWGTYVMNPQMMRRLSAIMLIVSILTLVYLPFSGEPPIIYGMSSFALLFTALLALGEAERWTKEHPEEDPEQPESE